MQGIFHRSSASDGDHRLADEVPDIASAREPSYGDKSDSTGIPGILVGYVLNAGQTWSRKYKVSDMKQFALVNLSNFAKVAVTDSIHYQKDCPGGCSHTPSEGGVRADECDLGKIGRKQGPSFMERRSTTARGEETKTMTETTRLKETQP